ncbi:divergent polysaccharide deacetylase family protein [Halalkalibacter urbisdiaboli]|uniref:divergent polysaccharide deacetylase family protein n=1 Tax=Halalkalibacter urbisdiaboli TaxID=1960589 RepID=UPI000B44316A|nr:divergent polysaccharide deacetylase family protein [Halalkalibacter urbisdiaboli]
MIKKSSILFILTISCLLLFNSSTFAKNQPLASIIIDDFGGDVNGVDEFLTGDIPVTIAIMPFKEQSTEQAELAHKAGHEVMIHLPMEPKKGKASWLGPKAITSTLMDNEIRQIIEDAIENVPHAVGLNNHMGSKIVENERIMRTVVKVLKENSLYIIDSGTSGKSVIPELAEELGVRYATRNVFLDDTFSSRHHVNKQMRKLSTISSEDGKAIGIGHVGIKGKETVAGICNGLSFMEEKGVKLVPISHLINSKIEEDPEHFWEAEGMDR